MAEESPRGRTRFVAYVYPGWHPSAYRPGVDEWALLGRHRERLVGQAPLPLPPSGPYRDDTDETAARHAGLAEDAGVDGFSYFLYFHPEDGLVLDEPMRRMSADGRVSVAATWCIRLPHDQFPVAPRDHMELPPIPDVDQATPLKDRPIETLSLEDLEALFNATDPVWASVAVYDVHAALAVNLDPTPGPDATAQPPFSLPRKDA